MAVKTLSFIILVTFVTGRAQAKEAEPDDVLGVVLGLKKEWSLKFAEQQNEISNLKKERTMQFAEQQNEISNLKKEWTMKFADQQTEISNLKKKVVEQENDIQDLKKKTEEQESKVKVLVKKTFELENEVAEQKRKAFEEESAAEELNKNYVEHDNGIAQPLNAFQRQNSTTGHARKRQTPERVAFSLYLSHPQEHTGIGQKIKFDAMLLNEGNGYNTHLAAFVAPTKGIYLFAYSIGKLYVGQTLVHLMKNGNAINSAGVEVTANYKDQQSGNVALVELGVGDVVCVEVYYQADAKLYGDPDYRYTTFSGVLLM